MIRKQVESAKKLKAAERRIKSLEALVAAQKDLIESLERWYVRGKA